MTDGDPLNVPVAPLEEAQGRAHGHGIWGPKTSTDDAEYYLPESLIGEWPYRYQGVLTHGGLAALMFAARQPVAAFPNLGYALGSYFGGRTEPVRRLQPSNALSYPEAAPDELLPIRNKLAGP